MLPAFKPGDHVLTFNWGKIKVGDVVVFRVPPRHFIKRIDKYIDNYVYVSGDNKQSLRSSSRHGGTAGLKCQSAKVKPIKVTRIVGKVILKY